MYLRSFADSDGDGVGDLEGLRRRLPYLADLGVDAVWVTPWYPSPMADGGYDVADYRDIDPRFGTLADADALLSDAHRLGLRLIVDLVANHTSEQHPWFADALASGPGSPARERYFFRDGRAGGDEPPNDWISAFGGAAWTRVTEPDGQVWRNLVIPEVEERAQSLAEFRGRHRYNHLDDNLRAMDSQAQFLREELGELPGLDDSYRGGDGYDPKP